MTTTRHAALFQCATCGTVDDVEHIGRDASRLTSTDRAALARRMRETLAEWAAAQPTRRYAPTWADVDALTRTMHHAIGCTEHDLRVCELDEIRGMASRTVGHAYDYAGRITT